MARRPLISIRDQKKTNWRAAFRALYFIPPFFREIRKSGPLLFFLNLLGRILNSFTPILILWVGKLIIDEIVVLLGSEATDSSQLWQYVGLELGIVICADVINRMITLTDGLLGDLYANQSSVRIIKKTNELNIAQLEDPEFYDKLERARMQTNSRVSLMSNVLTMSQDLIIVISLIAGLIYFEPWLIVLLVLSIIPSFINEIHFSTSRYSLARSWTAERRELDYLRYIGANTRTAKEMKLFGLTRFIANRFKRLSDEYYQVNKKLSVKRVWWGGVFNVLGVLSYYGAYVLIIYRVLTGIITLGDLTFLAGSFRRLRTNLQSIFSQFTRMSENALKLKDYFDFLNLEVEAPVARPVPIPAKIKTGFEIRNLIFTYPGADEPVLKGVSFRLNAGEKMAFVGENGAGKTTLIKLLLRFYEPDSGDILLDGTDIRSFDKEQYQRMFGVIFQDFIRYEFTIRENIAVGNIEGLDNLAQIKHAARQSLADQVVSEMKDGYDQQLGRRFASGTDLSGGQWQKIALARAYMKDAAVLILDEPTSALDARAEYEAFQRFIGLTQGKTSIIISHRFSTVRMADRIIVLKDGLILESGTHTELMDRPKLYAELFTLQAAGYR